MTQKLILMVIAITLLISGFFIYEILAQCGCPCGDICTPQVSTHDINCLPYNATWEGSCCDGGPKQVNFTCLPISWQGNTYTCLTAHVQHHWVRFDGCAPCPP